ncbi:CPBP family intramembrane metalloprotease [Clostridium sp. P21]|uniref:CPBP family intramembrane metalloprotease n=1 Tax=Clostridium muellerianum TaxID=2716538 RepID=A0A7Y0EK91_9CLOT|nr:type II CAAX endopeptidase family protein [Clostridium muellerianum]NMM65018.1 CPBP family intramembrane metalloprotease [Clostridium muellerianum]
MNNFFESTKIRKIILIYIAVVIFFCIISELSFVKSTGILDENLFLLLCNLGVLVWFMLKLRKVRYDVKKGLIDLKQDLDIKDIAFSIIINITITIGSVIIAVYALKSISPSFMKGLLEELNKNDLNSLYSIIINGIAASFIAPIVEEFVFRGVILNRLKMKIGIKRSVIISSILFGMIHYELGILSAIIFGICMSLIYLRTRNIFATIGIHIINNFIVFVVQVISFFIDSNGSKESITLNSFNLLWLISGMGCFILGIVMSIYFIKVNWNKRIIEQ